MSWLGDLWDNVAGPVIGGLFGLAGGRESEQSREGADAANRASSEAMARENIAMQREFAQHGTRWRVEDAKAAGLHPLFALTGGGAAFSPNASYVGSPGRSETGEALGQMGQDLSRAISAQETAEQRQMRQSSLKVQEAAAAKDFAIAEYYSTEAARIRTPTAAPFPSSEVHQGGHGIPSLSGFYDRTEIKASPVYSRSSNDPQVGAGSAPFWRAYQLRRDGLMIDLPFSEEGPSEALQDLPYWMYPEVVRHNSERYGKGWFLDFMQAYPDSPLIQQFRGRGRYREFEGESNMP